MSERRLFAERVETARSAAGLSIAELAERSGLTARLLTDRLRGKGGPFTVDELDAIAVGLGVHGDFSFLLTGQHDPKAGAGRRAQPALRRHRSTSPQHGTPAEVPVSSPEPVEPVEPVEAQGAEEAAVTAAVIGQLLGVSKDTIRQRALLGEIPGFRVGRQWRFWPSQVREHLRRQAEQRDPWARSPVSQRAIEREARKRQ
jgi:excisionase family DNA binding protein